MGKKVTDTGTWIYPSEPYLDVAGDTSSDDYVDWARYFSADPREREQYKRNLYEGTNPNGQQMQTVNWNKMADISQRQDNTRVVQRPLQIESAQRKEDKNRQEKADKAVEINRQKKLAALSNRKHAQLRPAPEAVNNEVKSEVEDNLHTINNTESHSGIAFLDLSPYLLWDNFNNVDNKLIRGLASSAKQASNSIARNLEHSYNLIKQGHIGESLFTFLNINGDAIRGILGGIPMQYVPSYAMPIIEDIPAATINRFGRWLFNDPTYTAILGKEFNNLDYSPEFNRVAKEFMGKIHINPAVNQYGLLTDMIHRDVSKDIDYGSSRLLAHPFNPTAGYARTIGRMAKPIMENDTLTNSGNGDTYDNAAKKTQYYGNKPNKNWSDWIRYLGGLATSYDTDSDDGKMRTKFYFDNNEE